MTPCCPVSTTARSISLCKFICSVSNYRFAVTSPWRGRKACCACAAPHFAADSICHWRVPAAPCVSACSRPLRCQCRCPELCRPGVQSYSLITRARSTCAPLDRANVHRSPPKIAQEKNRCCDNLWDMRDSAPWHHLLPDPVGRHCSPLRRVTRYCDDPGHTLCSDLRPQTFRSHQLIATNGP